MADRTKPLILTIFGATGDLTHRKLLPALYALFDGDLIPRDTRIYAIGRRDLSEADYRGQALPALKGFLQGNHQEAHVSAFLEKVHYRKLPFHGDDALYDAFGAELARDEHRFGEKAVRLFFLATAPEYFAVIAQRLTHAGIMKRGDHDGRILIEKPFGESLATARKLNAALTDILSDRQIFRIDHYLGKEMIRNILAVRFANGVFESLWDKNHIDNIQISLDEQMGVGTRGGYYEQSGVLRDMLQNHLMQMLSLVMMEPPETLDAGDVRKAKKDVVKALTLYTEQSARSDVVLGQYGPGDGMKGYQEEDKVEEGSDTPTFVALRAQVDTPRWKGMPVYLRSGKRMPRSRAQVVVEFARSRDVPLYPAFKELPPSLLVIEVQPADGLRVAFNVKRPGSTLETQRAQLDYCHSCQYGGNVPEAYETLLLDAYLGNGALFADWDEIEASWAFVESIRPWAGQEQFPNYAAGTEGPDAANELLSRDGRQWHNVDAPLNGTQRERIDT
ncbi:MAG: glucose-6-phosphate dehydrogenase [Clostridiales bacterium]|nr:glucose-6-phosphate dehydrogenase [Clostridiales bacterium]